MNVLVKLNETLGTYISWRCFSLLPSYSFLGRHKQWRVFHQTLSTFCILLLQNWQPSWHYLVVYFLNHSNTCHISSTLAQMIYLCYCYPSSPQVRIVCSSRCLIVELQLRGQSMFWQLPKLPLVLQDKRVHTKMLLVSFSI